MLMLSKIRNIRDSRDISEINKVLHKLLYVPNEALKLKIIEELLKYYIKKFAEENYKIKFFINYNQNKEPCGFVSCEINPYYRSRNRKCATFGWLHANNFNVCKSLIIECENYVRENNIRLLRGNINFPKSLGGIGIQVMGFSEKMMYGVPFNDPESRILEYLEKLGYIKDAEYICMEVTQKQWNKGKIIDKDIRLGYLTLKDIIERKDEVIEIAKDAFYSIVPDACTGRIDEILEIYSQVPDSHYKLDDNFNPRIYSTQQEILEAWESCNLEKVLSFLHLAFDRKTGKIVGAIFCLPDLYELWLSKPITRANVDTAMVKSEYKGKGVFSALNNMGQLTGNMTGIYYFEGTGIWLVNQDAINAIMPHCKTNRKFIVVQKRIKKYV
ncbi:MAG: hypothetical protein ACFFAS_20805 [Promethearchaeota archaeon]